MLMNDKYIMENILTLTKSVITLALNGAVESSNEKVLNINQFLIGGIVI